jgi:hypothetical protein
VTARKSERVGFGAAVFEDSSAPFRANQASSKVSTSKGESNNMTVFTKAMAMAVIAGFAPHCLAEDAQSRPCTASMLKGAYVITLTGTRPAPRIAPGLSGTPGTLESVLGVFLQIFDGKGGLRHDDPVIVKGSLSGLFPDQPGTGTYQVSANCSGSFQVNLPQLPAPLDSQMVILDNGRRFKAVVVSPQALMIAVEGHRVD